MTESQPLEEAADPAEPQYTKGFTWWRGIAIVAVVTMILYWTWIFSGAPAKNNPDRLQDRTYVADIRKLCKAMNEDIARLPNAADLETQTQRADVLDDANDIVAGFVDKLEAGAPRTGDASVSVNGWIEDWKKYLANREDYAGRLRTEQNAQLLLDRSELGDSVDKTIQIFTQVNAIPECDTPGDVG